MSAAPVRAFDSAYPGSMFERNDGYYVKRKDAASLAAALLEQIHERDRDIEDAQFALDQLRAVLYGVGVVGQIDGHDVIRRESVLEVIDGLRKARMSES